MRRNLSAWLVLGGLGLPVLASAQALGTVKPAGKEPTLAIGGLLQVQLDVGDRGDSRFTNDNDRFYLRRARLNATGKFPAPAPAIAAEIQVFAAASLTDALQEIATAYEKASGDKVLLNLGASSTLARQIQEGAPADLFFSADEAKMDTLEKGKLVLPGTRRSLLSNTLVVVVPADSSLKIGSAQDLASPRIRALALAEPQSVPAGIYAKQYLRSIKLWSKVIDRVVPTENVRAALAAVESGNVDAGIVYKTDAQISEKVKIAFEVPRAEGPKISYPVAVVAGSRQQGAARKLLAYLESPAALDVFRRYGFLTVSP